MANCCSTSYVFAGPESDLKEMRNIMLKQMNQNGRGWIGDVIEALGTNEYGGRGDYLMISDITEGPDGPEFNFCTDTAWSRMEDLESAVRKKYPDILIFYIEEELGCDIFCTNDSEGKHFKETVIIDFENEGMDYYTEEEALKKLSELKGTSISSWEEAVKYTDSFNNEQDEKDGEEHIWLHKAEIE